MRTKIQKGLANLEAKNQNLSNKEQVEKRRKNLSKAKELLQPLFVKKMYLADELERKSKMSLGKRMYKSVFSANKTKEQQVSKDLKEANQEYKALLTKISKKHPKGQKFKLTKEELKSLQPLHNRRKYLSSEQLKIENNKKLENAQKISNKFKKQSQGMQKVATELKSTEKQVVGFIKGQQTKLNEVNSQIKQKMNRFAEKAGKPSAGYKPSDAEKRSLMPLVKKRMMHKKAIEERSKFLKNAVLKNRIAFDKRATQLRENANKMEKLSKRAFQPSDALVMKMASQSLRPQATPKVKKSQGRDKRTR
ncbi:MAG: hypothetical protein K0T99_04440 [Alphaproteobacteria bacterium]|nr:hypothetical protein [Alphaproteobacteria bacterium]